MKLRCSWRYRLSASTKSGRSILTENVKLTGRFRPIAVIGQTNSVTFQVHHIQIPLRYGDEHLQAELDTWRRKLQKLSVVNSFRPFPGDLASG